MHPRSTHFGKELWEGLRRPSWLSICLGLALPVVVLAALAVTVTPELMASPKAMYFASHGEDTHLFVSARLARLKAADPDVPIAAVIGSSGIVEALTEEEELAAAVAAGSQGKLRVADLSCYGQSVLHTASIMDSLPERFDGLVVVNVSPRLIGRGWRFEKPFGNELALRSQRVEDLVRHDGVDMESATGNYLWDNRRFFLPRVFALFRNLATGPPAIHRHPYRVWGKPMGDEAYAAQLLRVQSAIDNYDGNFEFATELLVDVAKDLQRRGDVVVAFLEAPIKPLVLRELYTQEFFDEYSSRIRSVAEEDGFLYWNLNDEAQLEDSDFFDYTHLLTESSQRRFTELLGRRMADAVRERLP